MPVSDFYECLLYDRIEPFGDPRGDLQAGIIASTIANMSGKAKRILEPIDYMPFTEKAAPTPAQTAEELHAAFVAFKRSREKEQLD